MNKCPACGYQESVQTALNHNIMNVYVEDSTGKVEGVFNSNADFITVKGKHLRRQDLKAVPPINPAPSKQESKPAASTTTPVSKKS